MTTLMNATRAEAIATGHERYDTGEPCARGHHSARHTSTGGCLACITENQKKHAPAKRRRLKQDKLKYAVRMARYWTGRVKRLKVVASKREARQ